MAAMAFLASFAVHESRAADWTLTPRTRVSGEYADNPQLVSSSSALDDDGVANIEAEAAARLATRSPQYDFSIDPRLLFVRYDRRDLLDRDDQFLDIDGAWRGERLGGTLRLEGVRDTTLTSELGTTGLTDTNRRHQKLTIKGGPIFELSPRLALASEAGWRTHHYEEAGDTGLLDYDYYFGSARASYALDERTRLAAIASVSQIRVPDLDNRVTHIAPTLSLERRLSERWDASLSAGPSQARSQRGTEEGFVYQASTRLAGERTDAYARLSRSVNPTGRGVLTRADVVQVGVDRRLTERLGLGASGQWIRNRDVADANTNRIADRTTRYRSVEARLSWDASPSWRWVLSAQARDQNAASSAFDDTRAEGWSGNIAVIWHGSSWRVR